MNRADRRSQRPTKGLSNAQMLYNVLRTEATPRDAAATLSAVHAALIWDIERENEIKARTIAQEMVESIVTLWKVNRAAVAQQRKAAMQ